MHAYKTHVCLVMVKVQNKMLFLFIVKIEVSIVTCHRRFQSFAFGISWIYITVSSTKGSDIKSHLF